MKCCSKCRTPIFSSWFTGGQPIPEAYDTPLWTKIMAARAVMII